MKRYNLRFMREMRMIFSFGIYFFTLNIPLIYLSSIIVAVITTISMQLK